MIANYKGFTISEVTPQVFAGVLRTGPYAGFPLVGGISVVDVQNGVDALERLGALTVNTEYVIDPTFFGLPPVEQDDDDVCNECGVDPEDVNEADALRLENEQLQGRLAGRDAEVERLTTDLNRLRTENGVLRNSLHVAAEVQPLAVLERKFLHNAKALEAFAAAVSAARSYRTTDSVVMASVFAQHVKDFLKRALSTAE